jgi:hypothetical protein
MRSDQIMAIKSKISSSQQQSPVVDNSQAIEDLNKKVDMIIELLASGIKVNSSTTNTEDITNSKPTLKKSTRKTEDFIPSVDFSKSKVNMNEKSKLDKTSLDDAVSKMNDIRSE